MTEFKVGDRVKVRDTTKTSPYGNFRGIVIFVEKIGGTCIVKLDNVRPSLLYSNDEVELIEEESND